MDSIVIIDDKEVKFRATARTPRLYRMLIGRDMIADMSKLQKAYEKKQKEGEELGITDLQIFEDIAYVMARHADPELEEKSADEWLDSFNMFSIYEILPEILKLWAINTKTTSVSKKK